MIIFGWKMGITRDEFRVIKLGPLDSHVPVAKLTSGPRIFFNVCWWFVRNIWWSQQNPISLNQHGMLLLDDWVQSRPGLNGKGEAQKVQKGGKGKSKGDGIYDIWIGGCQVVSLFIFPCPILMCLKFCQAKRGKTFMIGRPTGKPTGKELPKGVPRAKAKMAMAMAKERSQDPLATDSTVEKWKATEKERDAKARRDRKKQDCRAWDILRYLEMFQNSTTCFPLFSYKFGQLGSVRSKDGTPLEEKITRLRMGDRVTRLPWSVAETVGTCWDGPDGPDGCPVAPFSHWSHWLLHRFCQHFVNIFSPDEIVMIVQLFEIPKI